MTHTKKVSGILIFLWITKELVWNNFIAILLNKRCPQNHSTVAYAPICIKRVEGIYVCVGIDCSEKGTHTPVMSLRKKTHS